jgi:uncharacterized membrane protein required for colicin V production
MDFNMVDMIIVGLVLFLAIKGMVNGFTQELFNFIALIGGVTIAARVHTMAGEKFAELNILPNITTEVQNFIGFLATFIIIWGAITFIASIITRISTQTPGLVSRIMGYLVGIVRYVAIFSLIVFGVSKADFLRENLAKHYEKSQLFTPMSNIGAKLLNLDSNQTQTAKVNLMNENNTTVKDQNQSE